MVSQEDLPGTLPSLPLKEMNEAWAKAKAYPKGSEYYMCVFCLKRPMLQPKAWSKAKACPNGDECSARVPSFKICFKEGEASSKDTEYYKCGSFLKDFKK